MGLTATNSGRLDRGNQHCQIGQVLDQLPDPSLELHRPYHPNLEAEVTQSAAQVIVDGNGLRLWQLAMSQQQKQRPPVQTKFPRTLVLSFRYHKCIGTGRWKLA